MNRIEKYLWVGWISIRSNLAYIGEVVARVVFLGVILYIFLQLWKLTYSESGSDRLAGMTLAQMLWYLAVTESITLSVPKLAQEIDEDVRTGALAVHYLRPISYPLYKIWTAMGERVVRFGVNLAVGSLIALLFVGPISVSASGLSLFLLAIPLAFLIDFLAYLTIGLAAFWLENTSGLVIIYSRVTMILGGVIIPIDLFPDAVQPVLRWLPFASIIYGPARLFVLPSTGLFVEVLGKQLLTVVVLSVLAAAVFSAATRRVYAHGG